MLQAVKKDGEALLYASSSLKADKEVVLAAVKNKGKALKYASPELQDDEEVVLAAVKQNVNAISFASEEICADKKFIVEALKNVNSVEILLNHVKDIEKSRFISTLSKEEILAIANNDGMILKYASLELQADKEVGGGQNFS